MAVRSGKGSLVLLNANVLTLDAARPHADAVVVSGERIVRVGERRELSAATAAADVIDCGGQTVVPGFIDAHCHVLAYAASLLAVDCSPDAVSRIGDIQRRVGERAKNTEPGEWIRAAGYSEFELCEKRHPTRWELDHAAPHHPVRLNHRSGHACVLNSVALERVGIGDATEEPPGGTIGRDLESGQPNGLLLEMDAWLDERAPRISDAELRNGVSLASREFAAHGVTTVQDATHSNDLSRWDTLRRMKADGVFVPCLYVMPSVERLDAFRAAGLRFGKGDSLSALGHAKIMLTRSGGGLQPKPDDLRAAIEAAHRRGFPVAIHAVEAEAVTAAADALEKSRIAGLRDRMEHASECPPEALSALASAKPVVVSQPRFIRDSGERYLSELGVDAEWLYRFKSMTDAGVALAASSDAPVSRPDPLTAMHAAVTRLSNAGRVMGGSERLTALQALKMHTTNAAFAICAENSMGAISPGKRADLAVLSDDPTRIEPERIPDVRVTMTMIDGKIVWRA